MYRVWEKEGKNGEKGTRKQIQDKTRDINKLLASITLWFKNTSNGSNFIWLIITKYELLIWSISNVMFYIVNT